MNKKDYGLGTESIRSLVFKLSIPSIVAMLANALYNIVDRIFIGQLVSEIAIGGVFITMPIMMVVMSFQMLAAIGGSTLTSIALGRKDHEKAEEYLNTSFAMLALMAAVITTISFVFSEQILRMFCTSPENHEFAKNYFNMVIYGFPAQIIGFGLNSFIRAEGNAKAAMNTVLIGVALNIILDPIFIYVFGMGVKGAALATVVSQYVSMARVLKFFLDKKHSVSLDRKYIGLKFKTVKEILENGMGQFTINIANALVNSIIVIQMDRIGGALGISVLSIVSSVTLLFFMPLFGINQGIQPIVGYNYGARSFDRLKEAYMFGAKFATTIALTVFVIIMIFPDKIGLLFLKADVDPKVFEYLVPALRRSMYASPVLGIAITGTSFFSAVKRPKIAMFTSLLRQFLILIPLIYIMPKFFGIDGIWWAYCISDISSFLIVMYFLIRVFREVKIECLEDNNYI